MHTFSKNNHLYKLFSFVVILAVILTINPSREKSVKAQALLPDFKLPYAQGLTVNWTGGPHGYNEGGVLDGTFNSGEGSGLDFANGTNFDVLAMADGVVVDAGCNNRRAFGCQIAVQHDIGGTVLIYAHLEDGSLKFSEGQSVKQGNILAKVGTTGTGARGALHLHIELRKGDKDQRGKWICSRECLPGKLGGNPLGWDDLVELVDGYRIGGYLVDSEGLLSYNYDGSAVKGDVKIDFDFPYHDYSSETSYTEKRTIARLDSSFQCSGSDPTDCEINIPGAATQFAGKGVFPNQSFSNQSVLNVSTTSLAGQLESSNTPIFPWARTYNGGGPANFIAATSDGGYIVADLFRALRLDGSGNIIWEKKYGGFNDHLHAVVPTNDGGFVMAGITWNFGAGGGDAWILKLDASGNIIWQNTYGGPGDDSAAAIAPTNDGGYVVAGQTTSFGAGRIDAWVFKLGESGNVIWQKTYGDSAIEVASDIKVLGTDGYVITGDYDVTGRASDVWVARLDESGNIVWQKTYGSINTDAGYTISPTNDGGYIVGGIVDVLTQGGNLWVLKLDAVGNLTWQKSYGGRGGENGIRLVTTSDGGYVAAGWTSSFGAGNADVWVFKLDGSGGIVWQKTFGTQENETAQAVAQTQDGGYIVGAGFAQISPTSTSTITWVIKLDGNGSVGSSCSFARVSKASARTPNGIMTLSPSIAISTTGVAAFSSGTNVGNLTSTIETQCGP